MSRSGAVLSGLLLLLTSAACRHADPLPTYETISDFHLIDQNGRPFHGRSLAGRIWVADFIYTQCPGPCPRMTSQMHQVQQATAKMRNVTLVSFTVDPEHDSPPVLAAYAKTHHAEHERWYFLTGSQTALNQLSRYDFKLGSVDGTLEHSTRFVLVDAKSEIRGYYDTSETGSIAKLIGDIQTLAQERT